MIDFDVVGAHVDVGGPGPVSVTFGIYLPSITWTKGYRVKVLVIHEHDQFIRDVPPREFYLEWVEGSENDLWQTTVELTGGPLHFGDEGSYVYRYQLLREVAGAELVVVQWFADPFGQESGRGALSAFTVNRTVTPFEWTDDGFVVPEVDGLVVYELHVGEFARDFEGVADGLTYLKGLGVNAIELMPITNVKEETEWGYTPLGYFAPDERFGGPQAFRKLVDACHRNEIAVVLDAVYAHSHPDFAYSIVYRQSGEPNPVMGKFGADFMDSIPGWNYRSRFTRDYFDAVNHYWMTQFHVDGFRYDYVPGFWDGPAGEGYAGLVFRTYKASQDFGRFPRFNADDGARSLIVQCAEFLDQPILSLTSTYSNTAWQNQFFDAAQEQAKTTGALDWFAHRLDPELVGYPSSYSNPATGDTFPVAPFQYFESHDHARFITRLGEHPEADQLGMQLGDRRRWAKTQPYAIALYTAKGVPMLWQGQEFAENWNLPGGTDPRRITYSRPLHWEYFYDPAGKALIRLYRILGDLRRTNPVLGSRGDMYIVPDAEQRRNGIIVFRRVHNNESVVVVLNFADVERKVHVEWPAAGVWREQLDLNPSAPDSHDVVVGAAWESHDVRVPSNYGAIYLQH